MTRLERIVDAIKTLNECGSLWHDPKDGHKLDVYSFAKIVAESKLHDKVNGKFYFKFKNRGSPVSSNVSFIHTEDGFSCMFFANTSMTEKEFWQLVRQIELDTEESK